MFVHPRFPEMVPAPVASMAEKALPNEAAFDASLAKWLAERRQRWEQNRRAVARSVRWLFDI
jgi:hypothetical protein